jgi:hypothetical protein
MHAARRAPHLVVVEPEPCAVQVSGGVRGTGVAALRPLHLDGRIAGRDAPDLRVLGLDLRGVRKACEGLEPAGVLGSPGVAVRGGTRARAPHLVLQLLQHRDRVREHQVLGALLVALLVRLGPRREDRHHVPQLRAADRRENVGIVARLGRRAPASTHRAPRGGAAHLIDQSVDAVAPLLLHGAVADCGAVRACGGMAGEGGRRRLSGDGRSGCGRARTATLPLRPGNAGP